MLLGQTRSNDPRYKEFTKADLAAILSACGGDEQLAVKKVQEAVFAREAAISASIVDPLNHGYVFENWLNCARLLNLPPCENCKIAEHAILKDFNNYIDELVILGGNRSSKTRFVSFIAVMVAVSKPNQNIAMFHSSAQSSIALQQSGVHEYLPPEFKQIKKTKKECVNFSKKNGFTESSFILPNGSQVFFFNYGQNIGKGIFEGNEFDLVIFDELVPMQFIETMRFRLVTRRGKMITTFTPLTGYTNVIAEYMAGSTIVSTEKAELLNQSKVHVHDCPEGHMPRLVKCKRENAAVFFFFSKDNVFSPYDELVKKCEGQPDKFTKIRAYGWADKQDGSVFMRYGKSHRMSRSRFKEIEKLGGTRYFSCDPGPAKNWFMKWYFVTPEGTCICYREWPDYQNYGNWAVFGDKGMFLPGPAQRMDAGHGISDIKRIILESEGWKCDGGKWDGRNAEKIEIRYMDPRAAGSPIATAEEGRSLISMFYDETKDKRGISYDPMQFVPAPSSGIQDSILMINDWLSYDDDEPVSSMNCPKFMFVDDLEQSNTAYKEWTGTNDALKDVIDPDRYLLKTNPEYIPVGPRMAFGQSNYYEFKRLR